MSDYLVRRPKDPHLLGQRNGTVFFGDETQAGLMKQDELKTEISKTKHAVLFRSKFEADNSGERETMAEQESAVLSRDSFEDKDGRDQATITEPKSGEIQEQGSRAIMDQQRIGNRIYNECLNVAEEVLTRYIRPYKKPLRFLKTFADELFEKKTKKSVEAYNDFLEDKISELQLRNTRFSGYQLARLALEAGMDHVGGEEYGRP
jgi:hypothetical protein